MANPPPQAHILWTKIQLFRVWKSSTFWTPGAFIHWGINIRLMMHARNLHFHWGMDITLTIQALDIYVYLDMTTPLSMHVLPVHLGMNTTFMMHVLDLHVHCGMDIIYHPRTDLHVHSSMDSTLSLPAIYIPCCSFSLQG